LLLAEAGGVLDDEDGEGVPVDDEGGELVSLDGEDGAVEPVVDGGVDGEVVMAELLLLPPGSGFGLCGSVLVSCSMSESCLAASSALPSSEETEGSETVAFSSACLASSIRPSRNAARAESRSVRTATAASIERACSE
jgi:hypothetical protein